METIKIVGLIALILFLFAYIGNKAITWLVLPDARIAKVEKILQYVASGSLTVAAACGMIHLLA